MKLNAPLDSKMPALGIAWQVGSVTGWGTYGLNLTLQLLRSRAYFPVLFSLSTHAEFNPLHRVLLQPAIAKHQQIASSFSAQGSGKVSCNFMVLRALGERCRSDSWIERISGTKTVGIVFLGEFDGNREMVATAQQYDLLVTGSTWNFEILTGLGLKNVVNVLQGIDPTVFHPAPRANWFGDRFVVFSGGKLEVRKGQDLVVAAFKRFHARHPDAVLVTAWHNIWPKTMAGIGRSPYVEGLPQVDDKGAIKIGDWLQANGLPAQAFVDCGQVPNVLTAALMRECDVALFPNRAEPGTNLVAMEAMACGVPTILSANTGHRDLLQPDVCYPLVTQRPVSPELANCSALDWGESDVEEIVAALEDVYRNRAEAQRRAARAVDFMQGLTWEKQIQKLVEVLGQL